MVLVTRPAIAIADQGLLAPTRRPQSASGSVSMIAAGFLSLALLGAPEARYAEEISAAVADVKEVWTVPPALVLAIIRQESSFDPAAVSRAGAIGLMQVMPWNARRVGLTVRELYVPRTNILAGVRLLAVLLRHYGGDVISALAGYNARPRKLFAPLPRNGETPGYVAAVLQYWELYEGRPLRLHRAP